MKIFTRIFMVMAVSIIACGCGATWFAEPSTNPVIEDKLGIPGKEVMGTLAVTANRRAVIVKLNKGDDADGDIGKFCAEPPPDASENIAYQLGLLLEGKAKTSATAEGEGKIDFNKALQTTIQSLTKRSQGLQLYRDGMFNLCQAYLNGVLDDDSYREAAKKLLVESVSLIEKELELTQGNIAATPIATPPENNPSGSND